MSIGVALIGSGIFATEEHLPAIQAAPDLTLRAVYSRTSKSAKTLTEKVSGVDIYSKDTDKGYNDLLKRSDIQAVIIALPIKSQNFYIRSALLAGKHVLSEKPVAENLQEAQETIKWYRQEVPRASWCVAENWRFLHSFQYACSEVSKMGRLLGFQVRSYMMVKTDWNYFTTEWRKNPIHQGGFLLDGGVHFVAGLRQLLDAAGDRVDCISAFTTQLQDYLPPVDTINAIIKTHSGISGTFQQSMGTTLSGNEWTVALEKGVVSVNGSKVTITIDGKTVTKEVQNERTGVPPEVRAWGRGLVTGEVRKEQEPEPALADLEILDLMLRSGEQGGKPMTCQLQNL